MKIRFTTVVKVKCILYLKYREGICISNTLLMDVFVIVFVFSHILGIYVYMGIIWVWVYVCL